MKTLQELYGEIIADDEQKKAFVQALRGSLPGRCLSLGTKQRGRCACHQCAATCLGVFPQDLHVDQPQSRRCVHERELKRGHLECGDKEVDDDVYRQRDR